MKKYTRGWVARCWNQISSNRFSNEASPSENEMLRLNGSIWRKTLPPVDWRFVDDYTDKQTPNAKQTWQVNFINEVNILNNKPQFGYI